MTTRYKQTWMTKAILSLKPGAPFIINNGNLEWLDSSPQPTMEEIESEMRRLIANEPLKIARESREVAYKKESDPLYFKVQRGEVEEQEWLNKVSEIRDRYPYPEITQEILDNVDIFEEIPNEIEETPKTGRDLLSHLPEQINQRKGRPDAIL